MSYLKQPSTADWENRQTWFEDTLESFQKENASYLVSEQACALLGEVETVYCSGAWIAVILIAFTVIDAQLRETISLDFKSSSNKIIDDYFPNSRLHALRIRRNRLIHLNPHEPAITVDQQWFNRNDLELEAKNAVELMFEVFFSSPDV